MEVSLHDRISGWCQRILSGSGEYWFVKVLD